MATPVGIIEYLKCFGHTPDIGVHYQEQIISSCDGRSGGLNFVKVSIFVQIHKLRNWVLLI